MITRLVRSEHLRIGIPRRVGAAGGPVVVTAPSCRTGNNQTSRYIEQPAIALPQTRQSISAQVIADFVENIRHLLPNYRIATLPIAANDTACANPSWHNSSTPFTAFFAMAPLLHARHAKSSQQRHADQPVVQHEHQRSPDRETDGNRNPVVHRFGLGIGR